MVMAYNWLFWKMFIRFFGVRLWRLATAELVNANLPLFPIWNESRLNQGRRSIWDRGDTSPQYLDWGDIITNAPSIFL